MLTDTSERIWIYIFFWGGGSKQGYGTWFETFSLLVFSPKLYLCIPACHVFHEFFFLYYITLDTKSHTPLSNHMLRFCSALRLEKKIYSQIKYSFQKHFQNTCMMYNSLFTIETNELMAPCSIWVFWSEYFLVYTHFLPIQQPFDYRLIKVGHITMLRHQMHFSKDRHKLLRSWYVRH